MLNDKPIKFPFYFKTVEGLICHTISENCYEGTNIIGLPKYFPLENFIENCRVIEGKPYLRMPTYSDSIERIRDVFPNYLKYVERFGEELCLFSADKIKKIYSPQKTAFDILHGKNLSDQILRDTQRLLEIVTNHFGISIDKIGIEGSVMLGGYRDNSDVDVVVIGEKESRLVVDRFDELGRYPEIHLYDMSNIDLIFSRRYKYRSFKSNEELFKQEKRRTTALINGRRFWLQPILGTAKCERKSNKRVKVDIIEDMFEIVNDKYSKFWPARYDLVNKKYGEVHLECYDPIYMNQAAKGNKVILRGPLYLDIKNEDKYIIMGPWISANQYLREFDTGKVAMD